ncbi:predicted protein [Thalassiosira pseudonana CCMP1335]|uniref:Mitochondrial import inner membrane translocase subunit TIM22 n=1 Tax=Thalassiosira pseudonana TaxID=35128 RepID=B8BRM2_THAPS|nr:predicted protein [Thalassiosira pseudonana CCMP1335]EED95984.1 predicted protein [Thalassiosira pseudonana CCMP1335]|eukprot:g1302.t1 g1302   contig10:1813277-1814179(+)
MGGGHDDFSSGAFNDPKHRVSGPGLTRTMYSTGIGAAAGTFYGACVAAWYPDPVTTTQKFGGTLGKSDFRAVGRTIARPAMWFSLAAGTFTATECVMEMIRNETQDAWNSLVAGMAGGAVIGLTTGKPQIVAATAIGMGIFTAAMDLSGAKTVHNESMLDYKRHGLLPKVHKESEALASLKEQFPKFKDL